MKYPKLESIKKMVRKYKRKRIIRKYKRKKSFKDRLKNFQKEWEGFVSLYDIIKIEKYKGSTYKWVIDHDFDYMRWAYNNWDFLNFDKEFKDYYEKAKEWDENYKEQRRKEEELRKHKEKQRRWYDSKSKRNNEWFNEFINRFSHGNYRYENTQDYSRRTYHHQQSVFSPAISEEKKYGIVLGLQGKVKKSEIKSKYLIALKKNHPDHCEKGTELEKKQAHLITIQIIEAWKFFKNKYAL